MEGALTVWPWIGQIVDLLPESGLIFLFSHKGQELGKVERNSSVA